MFSFKTKAQTVPEIIVSGLALFWTGFKAVWAWSLLLAFLSSIPTWILAYFMRHNYSKTMLLSVEVLALLLIPVIAFIVGLIIYQLYLLGSHTVKSFNESASVVIKKLPIIALALVLVTVIAQLGLLLFIIPGIFLAVMMVFVIPLILLDDHPLYEAFKYSFFLVWKSWWHTLSVLVLPLVLCYIALPNVFIGSPSVFHLSFDILRMTVVIPLLFAFILTMFYDSKLRHHVALHLPRMKKTDE